MMDQHLFRAPLGKAIESFKPMAANVVAGWVLAILLCASSVLILGFFGWQAAFHHGNLPWHVERGHSWSAILLWSFLALVLLAVSIGLAHYVMRLGRFQVVVCEHGFLYQQPSRVDEVRWSTIVGIRETVTWERPPIFHWPAILLLPKCASRSYTVVTSNGAEFTFDGNMIKNINRFGKMLHEHADAIDCHWETVDDHPHSMTTPTTRTLNGQTEVLQSTKWGRILAACAVVACVLMAIGQIGKLTQTSDERAEQQRLEEERHIENVGKYIESQLHTGKKFVVKNGRLVAE